ncbi:hypothetical protein G7K_5696-t4 [Saitoella complicata NRRL Y-17804]|uniref:Uncharacterized protein n=1 Tax=Saitoella complicata (strain BCRC 22490 / CBS 7301 / JCM 7358 / NBRC 10748 / NRRL Y-17804) TaxID=698492 RepID=A0A0E9NP69_SAICN|nr:hypothetical protein G7K_5696-t4 [Saitoella complicata NRRL Y-17804]
MMNLDGARARNRASTPTPSYTSSSTKQSIAIMSANLDRSLDEILATKPKRGGIRKAKGAQMRRKNNAGPAAQAAVAKAQQQQQRQQPQVAAKDVLSEESRIMLSNLPLDVPEPQIKTMDGYGYGLDGIVLCDHAFDKHRQVRHTSGNIQSRAILTMVSWDICTLGRPSVFYLACGDLLGCMGTGQVVAAAPSFLNLYWFDGSCAYKRDGFSSMYAQRSIKASCLC